MPFYALSTIKSKAVSYFFALLLSGINYTSLCLAFILFLTSSMTKADCDKGTIIMSGKPEYPPVSWSKDKQLLGLGFLTMKQITQQLNQNENLNLKLETTPPLPWKRAIQMTKLGKIDILVGIRESTERSEFLTFIPTPLIESAQNIFSLKGTQISTRNDLIAKTGGIIAGINFSSDFKLFAAQQKLALEEVQTLDQNIQKLELKRLDYFIAPLLPTIHHIKNSKIDIDIQFTVLPIFTSEEKIAISNKSSCLKYINHFNALLESLHHNGFIDHQFETLTQDWDVLEYVNSSK